MKDSHRTHAKAAGRWLSITMAVALILGVASSAQAQAVVEVGASLGNATIELGDNGSTTVAAPSLGPLSTGLYFSIFAGQKVSIEPRFGLFFASSDGDDFHLLNAAGQFNLFFKGRDTSSPYIFGTAGLISETDEDIVTTFGGGLGYRIVAGDRLALRLSGEYTHIGTWDEDLLTFTVSLGGLFGGKK